MKFETANYYILNADGLYYRGTSYGDERDWTNEKRGCVDGAFSYSLDGAWKKICNFPSMFAGCEVVHTGDIDYVSGQIKTNEP